MYTDPVELLKIMSSESTLSCLKNYNFLLFGLGLNRRKLDDTQKIINFLKFVFTKLIYISLIFYYNFKTYKEPDATIAVTLLQYWVTAEWLYLIMFPSGSKKLVDALKELDKQCGNDDGYFRQTRRQTNIVFYVSLCFLIVDILALYIWVPEVKFSMILVCLGMCSCQAVQSLKHYLVGYEKKLFLKRVL